jgi:hypothetical protein
VAGRKEKPEFHTVTVAYQRKYVLTEKVCPVCGEKFKGTAKAKYDKLACRMKADYARHAEERREYKRAKRREGKPHRKSSQQP